MKDDTVRMGRGGSCDYTPLYARAPGRGWLTPGDRVYDLGFRLARDPMQKIAKAAKDEEIDR